MGQYTLSRFSIAAILGLALAGCSATPTQTKQVLDVQNDDVNLRIATWNVEHLAFPIDQGCKPRTPAELAKLQAYASTLDADIVGLQEVGSFEAVGLLFPESDWTIIVSERPDSKSYTCRGSGFDSTQQKVAFAVKKALSVTAVQHLKEFGLDSPGLRYGLEIEVEFESPESGATQSMSVLNLHMKSGCFVDNYSRSDKEACQVFSRQAPILDNWVEQKEQQKMPYFIIGDFNHRLSAPYNHLAQALHADANGDANSLINTSAQLIGCHPYYPAPIDHIFAGNIATADWQHSAQLIPFADMQVDAMLSDHCALVADFQQNKLPLSNSVKWQTKSKEYQTLTQGTYQIAKQVITDMTKPNTAWVVVMDVDETVLDNSAYQVGLDSTGSRYTSETWAAWVKSEKATMTPGATGFIARVLNQGGKLALITNRNASLDAHTWQNLLALGLPLSYQNTCLLGRTQADIDAIDGKQILNDKDLRRLQVSNGTANCFNPQVNQAEWQTNHKIVMQIGDNIEDFSQVTQEHADIEAVLSELNKSLFLLPNPMYGSW